MIIGDGLRESREAKIKMKPRSRYCPKATSRNELACFGVTSRAWKTITLSQPLRRLKN
jgi:hypothetical protein